jgi:hypothetical protein
MGQLAKHGSSALSLVGAATATGLAVLTLGSPFAVLLSRLRRLARLGYGPGDIATALRATFERRREEFQFEYGLQLSVREKAVRAIAGAGFIASAASIVGILSHGPADSLGPLAFFAAYIGTIATGVSLGWRRLRHGTGSIWAGFWSGAKGRAVARFAAFGLGERATIGDRPTELAIAMSAEALHARLPKDIRSSLGDVPAVLRGLEAQARKARARIEELDNSVGEALRGKGGVASAQQAELAAELRAARGEAEERLSELVAALETLRLDLLRLSAGAGSVDGITADLAAAREFGEAADRLLASARDVEKALLPGQFPAR